MKRREFLEVAAIGTSTRQAQNMQGPPAGDEGNHPAVTIERSQEGRPHAGKVLLAVQPHADDIPLFAAGTVAKLLREGYTGYLVRVTNDDMAGPGSIGETVLANESNISSTRSHTTTLGRTVYPSATHARKWTNISGSIQFPCVIDATHWSSAVPRELKWYQRPEPQRTLTVEPFSTTGEGQHFQWCGAY